MPDSPDPRIEHESELVPSTLNFPVVGIGASAGGLAAVMNFFEHMPVDSGMAFVVVLHLSPKHHSDLDQLLRRATKMPVLQPQGAVSLEKNHVYVVPPTRQLAMNDSFLQSTALQRPRGRHVAIDLFFRSLARVHRSRAVGIVLSGIGADGAMGLKRIKEEGGITFSQLPEEAEFGDMPRAAVATGAVDWVLPVADMPRKLVELWSNAQQILLPQASPGQPAPGLQDAERSFEEALRDIMVLLRARTGHDFIHYKRATVLRRLARRLQVTGVPDLFSYLTYLHAHPDEAQALLKDLLIGVTNFFRDRETFEALERDVIPRLFDAPGVRTEPVRVWAPGCATGEEAYSLSILLCEHAKTLASPPEIQVFATDIDATAIAVGRAGAFPESIVADVPAARLLTYFEHDAHQYLVRKEVREKVLFAPHNLLRDPPFSKLDLICCRNLLIYVERGIQQDVLEMFHFALRPGGYLFLGSSESADSAAKYFSVVDKRNRIYRANVVPHSGRYLNMPLGNSHGRMGSAADGRVARQQASYGEIHRRLLDQLAPASVLIDADANIIHLSEKAGRYLRYSAGVPSHHLVNLALPELRPELRTAIFQVGQTGAALNTGPIRVQRDETFSNVTITVQPVQDTLAAGQLLLVLFDEQPLPGDGAREPGSAASGGAAEPLVRQLEEELKRTRDQLQATIEQSQTSTEELRASNEELQAINEELRSTTEELETSKEELQSINEELITVNHELKMKVEETGRINDDLQNLMSSTDIATVFVDRSLSIKRFTPAATQIFSIIPGDVGRSLLDITHRLGYPELAGDAQEAFLSLRSIEREVSGPEQRWFLARILPYRTSDDRIDGAVLTFVDVTSRRQAEERLRQGEERMRLVAESTRDYAIVTLDLDGAVLSWNQGAERLFGHAEADMVGKSGSLLFLPEDVEAGAPYEALRVAREEGRCDEERWQVRKDGSRVFCSAITTPLVRHGVLQGYARISRDLTTTRRAEKERERLLKQAAESRAEAQAAAALKDEFLAIMSHELKNPLNLIQLNAELLSRMPQARTVPAMARAADVIRRTVLSQAKIIDDLLDLSRVKTGKMTLNIEPVDWGGVVRPIASALASDTAAKEITVTLDVPVEPVMVAADAVRVEQIVWNLLSNATKFTSAGGSVTVRLRAVGGFGMMEVSDTGRGIQPEFLTKVFDMFQQANMGSTRQEGGLGIGLALVKNLSELHGGKVSVRSEGVGKGTTFTVSLPLVVPGLSDGAAAEPPETTHGFGGHKVLVVEDDAQSAETLRQLLEIEHLQVTVAVSGQQALEAVDNERFDIIISDVAMPEMDGYQLAEALRRHPRAHATPLIALTGLGRPADVRRALAAGFNAHLSKPLSVNELTAVLAEVLPQSAGEMLG